MFLQYLVFNLQAYKLVNKINALRRGLTDWKEMHMLVCVAFLQLILPYSEGGQVNK